MFTGFLARNSGLSCDAWDTLQALEAQWTWGARYALDSTGAIGALDTFGAQFPSAARLSFLSNGATGTQLSFVPWKAIRTCDALVSFRSCGTSWTPVTHISPEALRTWKARVSYVALLALEATDARGPRRTLWAKGSH